MVLCLGEPPRRFFWCLVVVVLHFILIFICRCSSFRCCCSFTFAFQHHPSLFRGLSSGFYTHFILSAQPIPEWFAILSFFNFSVIFLPWALRFWVGVFYTQVLFTLCSFTDILTCVYQGFPGSWQFFLEVFRASYWSLKHRPGPCVCLIHSNPQYSHSEWFSFKFYHILVWITCGEKFSFRLPYLFQTLFRLYKVYVKTLWTRDVPLITASMNIKLILSIIENNQS